MRTLYSSEFISTRQHNPRFLFKSVDQLVNPAPLCASVESDGNCEMIFFNFTDKVESIRASISPHITHSDVPHPQQDSFKQFYPLTLSELLETVCYMQCWE